MPKTKISVDLRPGPENALENDSAGLFAPKVEHGLRVVGTGHRRATPPEAPHFRVEIPVPGAEQGDYAIVNADINKDKEAQWAMTHHCGAGKVVVVLNRQKDGTRPFADFWVLVLRVPTSP